MVGLIGLFLFLIFLTKNGEEIFPLKCSREQRLYKAILLPYKHFSTLVSSSRRKVITQAQMRTKK
jgi:hypothetical protein